MSFVYWVFEDKDCFTFPHNAGYVGVSEDPTRRWHGLRTAKTAPKTAKLLILYEGTREECLRREYQLRPSLRIGWNTLRGGTAREPGIRGRRPLGLGFNFIVGKGAIAAPGGDPGAVCCLPQKMVEPGGIEPPTSCMMHAHASTLPAELWPQWGINARPVITT
jgi:hypothetical protein